MSKFKVGDKVVVVKSKYKNECDQIGSVQVVREVINNKYHFGYNFTVDDYGNLHNIVVYWDEEDLRLATPEDSIRELENKYYEKCRHLEKEIHMINEKSYKWDESMKDVGNYKFISLFTIIVSIMALVISVFK